MIAQERRDRRTIRVFLNRQRSRFLSSRHVSTARIENKTNPRRIILPLDKYSSKLHRSFMHTNRKYFQKLDYSLNLHLPRSSETMIDDKRFERLAKTKKWIKKATAKWRYSIILSRHFNRKKKKKWNECEESSRYLTLLAAAFIKHSMCVLAIKTMYANLWNVRLTLRRTCRFGFFVKATNLLTLPTRRIFLLCAKREKSEREREKESGNLWVDRSTIDIFKFKHTRHDFQISHNHWLSSTSLNHRDFHTAWLL